MSLLEHGVYVLLLDRYYVTEAPLPLEKRALYRLVRASSKVEREAVETVIGEFFYQQTDGWHHKRCDEEIAKYREGEPDREAKRENAKERQRRARKRRAVLFETLRGHGIVPAFDAPMAELQAIASRVTGKLVTQPVTRDATATHTQTPDTSKQQEQKPSAHAASPPEPPASPPTTTEAGRACVLMRQAGCARVNPSNANLLAAIDEGITPEALRDTAVEAIGLGKSEPFSWAITTARNRHAEGPQQVSTGPPRLRVEAPQSRTLSAIQTLQGSKTDAQQSRLAEERDSRRIEQIAHAEPGSTARA